MMTESLQKGLQMGAKDGNREMSQDGHDITAASEMPSGGWGIRGWLSAIYRRIHDVNVIGREPWDKLGFNAAATVDEIISPQGGDYVFPDVEQQMHVIGGTEDTAGGTGIRTLTIYYLDGLYAEKSVDVILTGTTAAVTLVSDIFRVQSVRAKTVGSGGAADGNISIENAAETITYGYIEQGYNRQRQLAWTVPAGKILYIDEMNASAINTAANKYCIIEVKATYDDKAGIALPPGVYMVYSEIGLASNAIPMSSFRPLVFVTGTDLLATATGNSTATVTVGLRGWLEKA